MVAHLIVRMLLNTGIGDQNTIDINFSFHLGPVQKWGPTVLIADLLSHMPDLDIVEELSNHHPAYEASVVWFDLLIISYFACMRNHK